MVPIPSTLREISRKVVRLALGEAHVMLLFAGGELAIYGNNSHG